MKKDLVIYGAGGLGRETASLARLLGRWNILGFVDDGKRVGEMISGLPVLSGASVFKQRNEPLDVIIGIANTEIKAQIYERLKACPHISFPVLIAPDAYIDENAHIDEGCVIQHFCTVSLDTHIGKCVLLNAASHVGHDTVVGDFCTIMPSCNISGEVQLGERCLAGAQTFVLQGKSIGARTTLAAGSKVFSNVDADVTVFGCPASVIDRRKPKNNA